MARSPKTKEILKAMRVLDRQGDGIRVIKAHAGSAVITTVLPKPERAGSHESIAAALEAEACSLYTIIRRETRVDVWVDNVMTRVSVAVYLFTEAGREEADKLLATPVCKHEDIRVPRGGSAPVCQTCWAVVPLPTPVE